VNSTARAADAHHGVLADSVAGGDGALPYAPDDRRDGVVGLSFAMRQVAQLLLMCDRQDIGISIGSGEQGEDVDLNRSGFPAKLSDQPRIFVYDNYPGGIGFSQPLFAMHDDLLARTRELIAGCDCAHGCPTCVGPVGNTGRSPRRWLCESSS
jgi:DEAD/DEAH box helicase domain-containing protein